MSTNMGPFSGDNDPAGAGALVTICDRFQFDLSCLVDGELEERAAAGAMLHLEACETCRTFFSQVRQCVEMHRDVSDPARLMARVAMLTGTEWGSHVRSIEVVQRLATIFYQLGKAYVLAAMDPGFRTRVFESVVPVESTQIHGRGFVDGVLSSAEAQRSGVDWTEARHWLNGRLKQIEQPLEKGKQLLNEAIRADPTHEEARIYRAWVNARENKRMAASKEFREVFRGALSDVNRGHAATQLGLLHVQEGDHRSALACFRWVRMSGLERRDERFFFVGFNIAVQQLALGNEDQALASLRRLLDEHAQSAAYVAELVSQSQTIQSSVETRPSFAQALLATCPELFQAGDARAAEAPQEPRGLLEFETGADTSCLEF